MILLAPGGMPLSDTLPMPFELVVVELDTEGSMLTVKETALEFALPNVSFAETFSRYIPLARFRV